MSYLSSFNGHFFQPVSDPTSCDYGVELLECLSELNRDLWSLLTPCDYGVELLKCLSKLNRDPWSLLTPCDYGVELLECLSKLKRDLWSLLFPKAKNAMKITSESYGRDPFV